MGRLHNINKHPRFTQCAVSQNWFQEHPVTCIDVGARGGFETFMDVYQEQMIRIGFEPDQDECRRLNEAPSSPNAKFYPYALYNRKATLPFYITHYPAGSSFLEPDANVMRRLNHGEGKRVSRTITLDTIEFDAFVETEALGAVDYMKLDAEGCEHEILEGAKKTLRHDALCLSIETWLQPAHKNMRLFSDIDQLVRSFGFTLFDFSPYRHERRVLPEITPNANPAPSSFGQSIWGQVLYLRDWVADALRGVADKPYYAPERLLKLVSFFEIFGLNDCAIEMMLLMRNKNALPGFEYDAAVNLLVPPIQGQIATYQQYLDFAKQVKNGN